MSKDRNFATEFARYGLFALLFIIIGILIASGLSLPGSTTADETASEPKVVNVDYQFPVNAEGRSPFVAVAAMVKDAVVNISAESIREGSSPHEFLFNDDLFRRFFGVPQPQENEPQKRISQSLGSGFIISKDGYVVTNNHVVKDADRIQVRLSDASEYPAEVVGTDPETDLALLKIDPDHDLATVKLGNSSAMEVGDWAIAVGNPFPQLGLDRTVTVGVISAKGRRGLTFGGEVVSYQDYIQTDASINRGNSGGPLVNIRGEVIGINSAIASTSGGSVGIGFAIPIDLAKPVIESLKKTGAVERGWLGVSPQEIDKELAEAMDLPGTGGVLIGEVIPDSPAEKAGFESGDVVVTFDGAKITDLQQFRFRVAGTPPNKKVKVEIIRKGKTKTLDVVLGDRAEALNIASSTRGRQSPEKKTWLGISVKDFTESMAQRLGMEYEPGVVITDVEVGSPADRQGLRRFDIIIEIDNRPIRDMDDFNKVTKELEGRRKAISIFISRGGSTRYLAIKPDKD